MYRSRDVLIRRGAEFTDTWIEAGPTGPDGQGNYRGRCFCRWRRGPCIALQPRQVGRHPRRLSTLVKFQKLRPGHGRRTLAIERSIALVHISNVCLIFTRLSQDGSARLR
jgi:hypothetical protein